MSFICCPLPIFWKYATCKINLIKNIDHYNYTFNISSLNLSNDWFSISIPSWMYTMKHLQIHPSSKMNILEIGSFEGCSTYFLLDFFKNSTITAVDTWNGSIEHKGKINFIEVEKRFDQNILPFKNRLKKMKSTSNDFFTLCKDQRFELIYIDGDHHASAVYQDAVQAFLVLKINGVLIFDDFNWRHSFKLSELPGPGIIKFIKDYKSQLKVIYVGYQLHIQKIY